MFDVSFPLIVSTFGIIFLAELPDKTAFASLMLGARYKARDVILGSWLALLVQTLVAVAAGSLLTLLPAKPVHLVSGAAFIVFALMAFFRKEEEEEREEEEAVAKSAKRRRPAWLSSFLVVFAAEWGDLTQLATAALVAQHGHPLSVGIGATAGLWLVAALAAIGGAQLQRVLDPKKLTIASGVVFAAIGAYIIVSALAAG